MVRGRVFYLRMRVLRSLEARVGRTHLWRSLGTANKAEAVRQARIVAYDLEVALRGEPEPRADRPQIVREAPQKADATVEPPCPPKPSEKTLRTLRPIFLNDATKVRGDKVRMIYNHTIPIVGEGLGMDTPLPLVPSLLPRCAP